MIRTYRFIIRVHSHTQDRTSSFAQSSRAGSWHTQHTVKRRGFIAIEEVSTHSVQSIEFAVGFSSLQSYRPDRKVVICRRVSIPSFHRRSSLKSGGNEIGSKSLNHVFFRVLQGISASHNEVSRSVHVHVGCRTSASSSPTSCERKLWNSITQLRTSQCQVAQVDSSSEEV